MEEKCKETNPTSTRRYIFKSIKKIQNFSENWHVKFNFFPKILNFILKLSIYLHKSNTVGICVPVIGHKVLLSDFQEWILLVKTKAVVRNHSRKLIVKTRKLKIFGNYGIQIRIFYINESELRSWMVTIVNLDPHHIEDI